MIPESLRKIKENIAQVILGKEEALDLSSPKGTC
jgi:hypothetical protein